MKNWLIGKDSDAGRDWGQEKKETTEDEMSGWYHWLDGRESEWTLGVGDGQGRLLCCSSWGCKESDTTEWLKWTKLNINFYMTLNKSLKQSELQFPHVMKWANSIQLIIGIFEHLLSPSVFNRWLTFIISFVPTAFYVIGVIILTL